MGIDDGGGRGQEAIVINRDAAAIITRVSGPMADLLGWEPETLIGRASTEFIHPEDQASAVASWIEMMQSDPNATVKWQGRYQRADGRWQWVKTVNENRLESEGLVRSTMSAVAVAGDGIVDELRAREQLFTRLADALPVGVVQFDRSGTVVFSNRRIHTMLAGARAATIEALFQEVCEADHPQLQLAVQRVLRGESVDELELCIEGPPRRIIQLNARALTDSVGAVNGAVACLADVTSQVELRDELHSRAATDPLTGCLNRAAILEQLTSCLEHPDVGVAVFFIDLDSFKQVNDQHGHAAGDHVLRNVAARLRAALRPSDHLGRIGGDEFLLVCTNVDLPLASDLETRLVASLTAPIEVGPTTVTAGASIGLAWSDRSIAAAELVARADAAMYQNKAYQDKAALQAPAAPDGGT